MAIPWVVPAVWLAVAASEQPAAANPPTYFTAQHVDALRAAARQKGWVAEQLRAWIGTGTAASQAAFWKGISQERIAQLIPSRPPLPTLECCPACRRPLARQEGYDFQRDPFRLVCPGCGTVFYEQPDAGPAGYRFREEDHLEVAGLDGNRLSIPFRKDGSQALFISNMIWSRRASPEGPLAQGLRAMTAAYVLGGDPALGLAIVALLERLATVYDAWPLWVADHNGRDVQPAAGSAGRGFLTRAELMSAAERKPALGDVPPAWVRPGGPGPGRLTPTLYEESRWLTILADAYAAVRATDLPETLERTLPSDRRPVRQRIEERLFRPAVALLVAHPAGKHAAAMDYMKAAARLAVLFENAALADRAAELWEYALYDLHWHDGTGTSGRLTDWLSLQEAIVDYADLSALMGKDLYGVHPFIREVLTAWTHLLDPQGRWPPVDGNPAPGPTWTAQARQSLALACLYYDDARAAQRLLAMGQGQVASTVYPGVSVFRPAALLDKPLPKPSPGPNADPAVSENFGGMGLAILRSRTQPVRVMLDYGHTNAWQHGDLLGLLLWWRGISLVNDPGCGPAAPAAPATAPEAPCSAAGRPEGLEWQWAWNSGSHSLVQVDGQAQVGGFGHLLEFQEVEGTVGLVDAEAPAVYRQWWKTEVSRYRRTVALVTRPDNRSYVVDIFRVRGGQQHDYLLHVSADQMAPSGGGFEEAPGTLLSQSHPMYSGYGQHLTLVGPAAVDPDVLVPNDFRLAWKQPLLLGNGYGFIERLSRSRELHGPMQVTWTARRQEAEAGLRLHALTKRSLVYTESVFLGWGPDLVPGRGPTRAVRPVFVSRRAGRAPLETTFIHVLEPFDARGPAAGQALDISHLDAWGTWPRTSVGLSVEAAGLTDLFLHNATEEEARYRDAQGRVCRLVGDLGLIRLRGNQLDRLVLMGGGRLMIGDLGVGLIRPVRATVVEIAGEEIGRGGTSRLVVRSLEPLATDRTLMGQPVLIQHGDGSTTAFTVGAVEKDSRRDLYRLTLAGAPPLVLSRGVIRHILEGRQRIVCDQGHAKGFNDRWLEQKWLRVGPAGRACKIARLVKDHPDGAFTLELDGRLDMAVQPGARYVIASVAVGDGVRLPTRVELRRLEADRYHLQATGDVTLLVPETRRGLVIHYRRRDGKAAAAERLARDEGFYIPITELADGQTQIDVDRRATATQPSAPTTRPEAGVEKRRFRRRDKDRPERPSAGLNGSSSSSIIKDENRH